MEFRKVGDEFVYQSKNGFTQKPHLYQIFSYVIFVGNLTLYSVYNAPMLAVSQIVTPLVLD